MRQHLPQFPLGETTRNLLVSRQTQNGVSQSHDGDDDQKMDRISTDKCNAASTTATCPEGSETESMCDSADSYDILSPNGSDDDGVPVSDSDEESYQDCLDEDVNDADDSQSNQLLGPMNLINWSGYSIESLGPVFGNFGLPGKKRFGRGMDNSFSTNAFLRDSANSLSKTENTTNSSDKYHK
ncbi:hypothetical protein OUZ56_024065 [Daphnia magna]|uniref:Uncharacterized protein n=1 Tax=Daphnia magna TaxID=35525 RepID=A0ABR0B016_9CRUS|nr:hypothetical protein OUZ56_024065 [Daphnia magna]